MLASCQVRRQPRSSSEGGSVDFPADKAYRRGGQMIDGGSSFDNIIERERGLRRQLSARRLTMIAIGGAIGTGLFLGSGFAISLAGPAVLVSYAVGAVIALLLMGCLAEMTLAHPTSGSFGAYAEYYIDPLAGFLVRYAYWTSIVLAVGTEVTAVALYMRFWFPALPGWLWIVAFSALLIGVNARSVNVFGAVEYWFSALKVTAIVIFILLAGYIVLGAPSAVPAAAAGIFNFVILVAALSAMNSQLYITTRMMFSLSRAHHAPRRFGVLNRRGVPVQALLFSSIGIALAALLSIVAPQSAFILMVSISAFGAMFTWMMIFITHYRFRRARARTGAAPLRFRMVGFPATTLLGAALMGAALLTTAFTDAFRMTLLFGLPFLACLSAAYWIRRRQE